MDLEKLYLYFSNGGIIKENDYNTLEQIDFAGHSIAIGNIIGISLTTAIGVYYGWNAGGIGGLILGIGGGLAIGSIVGVIIGILFVWLYAITVRFVIPLIIGFLILGAIYAIINGLWGIGK